MRSLLTDGTPGPDLWAAFAWSTGILVVFSCALAAHLSPPRTPSRQPNSHHLIVISGADQPSQNAWVYARAGGPVLLLWRAPGACDDRRPAVS